MTVILRYSTNFGSFGGHLRKVVEDKPTDHCLRQKCSPMNLVLFQQKFMAISPIRTGYRERMQ